MDISGHISKISGNIAFDECAIDFALLVINFLHDPYPPCNGNLISNGRRFYNRTKFLRTRTNGIFYIFLKNRIEFVAAYNPLTGKPYDQATIFSFVDMIYLNKMLQKQSEVIL